ncbi:MAG: glutathione peroxidase [Chitinophagales bacterium]|nr:glutathione peroxidase [Chitinophagales bacterium]
MKDSLYQFTLHTASGKALPLDHYKGKVLLVVNTATGCGLWPQMKDLEKLSEKYRNQGLEILLFPSNSFYQEPKSGAEMQQVCEVKFNSTFTVFEKGDVKGSNAQPLYKWLRKETRVAPIWNFHKYVIDRNGRLADWFNPWRHVNHDKVTALIEKLLADKPN